GSPRRGPCGFPHANTKRSPHPRGWGLVQAVEVKDSALVAAGAAFAGLAAGAAFAGLAAGAAFAGLATGAAFAGLATGAAFAGLAAGAGFTGLAAGAAGAALALDAVTEAERGIGRRAHDTVVDLALEARLADGELLGLVRTRARVADRAALAERDAELVRGAVGLRGAVRVRLAGVLHAATADALQGRILAGLVLGAVDPEAGPEPLDALPPQVTTVGVARGLRTRTAGRPRGAMGLASRIARTIAPVGRERLAVRDAGTPELRITVGHVVVGVATLELLAVRRDALEVVVFATRHREAIGEVVGSQVPGAEGAHGLAVGVGAARPQPELRTVVEGHALQARRLVLRARRILGAGEELPRRQRDRGATTVPVVAVVPLLALVVVGITLT